MNFGKFDNKTSRKNSGYSSNISATIVDAENNNKIIRNISKI